MSEAEKAATHLGKLRAGSGARSSPSRTYPHVALGLALAVIVCGSALAIFLSGHDLRTDANPHADGSIPLPANAMAAGTGAPPVPASGRDGAPPAHAEGTPDVGAMVPPGGGRRLGTARRRRDGSGPRPKGRPEGAASALPREGGRKAREARRPGGGLVMAGAVRINLLPHREQKRQARQRQFVSFAVLLAILALAVVDSST